MNRWLSLVVAIFNWVVQQQHFSYCCGFRRITAQQSYSAIPVIWQRVVCNTLTSMLFCWFVFSVSSFYLWSVVCYQLVLYWYLTFWHIRLQMNLIHINTSMFKIDVTTYSQSVNRYPLLFPPQDFLSSSVLFCLVQSAGARTLWWHEGCWGKLQSRALAAPQFTGSHAVSSAPTSAQASGAHTQILQPWVSHSCFSVT